MNSFDINTLCHQYINIVYHNMSAPRAPKDAKEIRISETYGEILYCGVEKLISEAKLTEEDVFLDLGSGSGKVVIQVFLKTMVKEAIGIELLPELFQQSLFVSKRLKQELPDFYTGNRELAFLHGSFLDISLNGATVVVINSICYSQYFLSRLGEIIDKTPSIHTFMTLRPITTMRRLSFKKTIRVECSWDTTLCYIYGL
jgi:hypothetical protein